MEIKKYIIESLKKNLNSLKLDFLNSNKDFGCRYCYVDNLLPNEIALLIGKKFPSHKEMRLLNSHREKKYTSKQFSKFDPIINEIAFALQNVEVIQLIENITCISNQMGDPSFYAGGVSSMIDGNFLNPHLDNSHNYDLKAYRTLNLLYYVTPNWHLNDGGHLELWDKNIIKYKTIESKFNRLVLMETNQISWHSVSKINNNKLARNCVSNYYFSNTSPTGYDYSNVTEFSGRPDQYLRRFFCFYDNLFRNFLRKIKKKGFAKVDLNK